MHVRGNISVNRAISKVNTVFFVLIILAKTKSILPEGLAFELIHDRFFNSSGKAGGNIPLDLRMEHLNKLLKAGLTQLGANITEESAKRIAESLEGLETLLNNVDKDISMQKSTQHRGTKHLMQTVKLITEDLVVEKVFVNKPDRQYKSFMNFNRDILHKLDQKKFYEWAKQLFQVWDVMYD